MKSKLWKNSTSCLAHELKKLNTNFTPVILIILGLFITGVSLFLTGCPKIPPIKTYEQAKKEVEAQGPQVTPTIEEREGYKPGTSKVLPKDTPAPINGILIDKDRATYLAAIKAERDRRRTELEIALKKAAIDKLIYDSTLDNIKARANHMRWWHDNKGWIGFVLGGTIIGGLVVGIVYALTAGKGVSNATSNTLVLQPVK